MGVSRWCGTIDGSVGYRHKFIELAVKQVPRPLVVGRASSIRRTDGLFAGGGGCAVQFVVGGVYLVAGHEDGSLVAHQVRAGARDCVVSHRPVRHAEGTRASVWLVA